LGIREALGRLDLRFPAAGVVGADEVADWPPSLLVAAQRAAWFRPATPAQTADCDACDGDHASDVLWVDSESDRAYIDCPSVGRVAIDTARLVRWHIDDGGVASWLARELGVRAAPEIAMSGLWRLGGTRLAGVRRAVFLMIGGVSTQAITDATKRTRAPLVFSCAPVVHGLDVPTFRLADLVVVRDERLAIDRQLLEELCDDVLTSPATLPAASTSTSSGRPSGRTMGSMLDCWFTCHNLGDGFDSPHEAYVAIDRSLSLHPPSDMAVLPTGRYSSARSRAGTRRSKLGRCTWWRCAEGPPSDLLSA
jgi:hypothetical protein